MKKISNLNETLFKSFLLILLILQTCFMPIKANAEIAKTEINSQIITASTEFLRDLDYETWQLVAYKSSLNDEKLILRIVGYPGSLRIDHPLDLNVESGRKQWMLNDLTLLNEQLANDSRQAAAEFDLEYLMSDLSKNRPLRLSLEGVFSELPVPPFLVEEWRSIG